MWFSSDDLTATNGSLNVVIGDSADVSAIVSGDALYIGDFQPVEISSAVDGTIVLNSAWAETTQTSVSGFVIPTMGDFSTAAANLQDAVDNLGDLDSKIDVVGGATANDIATFTSSGQVQDSGVSISDISDNATAISEHSAGLSFTYDEDGASTADVYVLTSKTGNLVLSAYNVGQIYRATIASANTTTTPTISIDGLTALTIVTTDGGALAAGDIIAGQPIEFRYNGTYAVLTHAVTSQLLLANIDSSLLGLLTVQAAKKMLNESVAWIVPSTYTGAYDKATVDALNSTTTAITEPDNLVTNSNLDSVGADTSIEINNPFGDGVECTCDAYIYLTTSTGGVAEAGWYTTGFVYAYNDGAYGVASGTGNGKIIVQTGSSAIAATSRTNGGSSGNTSAVTSAPVMVKCYRKLF